MKKHGIKIKACKSQLFCREISYLGLLVSSEGFTTDLKNVVALTSKIKKRLKTIFEFHTVLGFVSYFWKFIPNFTNIASPLYDLPNHHQPDKSSKETTIWEQKYHNALNTLLYHLTNPPLIAYPDFTKPFILHTDASARGSIYALYQYKNDELRVLGYGSHTFIGAESKNHSSKPDFLILKWAICEHFIDYLYYSGHFQVFTGYNPVVYLKWTCKASATGQQWVNELADYIHTINYKPVPQNKVADRLSRHSIELSEYLDQFSKTISDEEVKLMFNGSINQNQNGETWIQVINNINCSADSSGKELLDDEGDTPTKFDIKEILAAQDSEEWIKHFKEIIGN